LREGLEKRKLKGELCGRGCSGPCVRCPAYFLTGDGWMLLEITREKERELMLWALPPRRAGGEHAPRDPEAQAERAETPRNCHSVGFPRWQTGRERVS
jgi:hypothetical protein